MIKFEEYKNKENQTVVSAYIDNLRLAVEGKKFAEHVLAELIKKSVYLHMSELQQMIDAIVVSQETQDYIRQQIRTEIDKQVKEAISDMFKGK
jgi:hypothetical protein